MKYDPTKHHRRSIRLKGYDYRNAGAYFVTICTKNRECVLDDPIVNAIVRDVWYALPQWFPTIALDEFVVMPNHTHFVVWNNVGMPLAGNLDGGAWTSLANVRDGDVGIPLAGVLDAGVQGGGKPGGGNPDGDVGTPLAGVQGEGNPGEGNPDGGNPDGGNLDGGKPRPYGMPKPQKINPAPALGDIVGAFKSLVFTVYLDWIEVNDPPRRAKFWQGNYYEHIVRNERELDAIRQYIIDNPVNWKMDRDNLENTRELPPPEKVEDYLQDVEEMLGIEL